MLVAVFGSAAPKPESSLYEQGLDLGRRLAEAGFSVMTGGYCGLMEAVSRGALEAGGKTIGVTCSDIDAYRPGGPNKWVQECVQTENLNKRLEVLTRQPDAFIALPGGIGTLGEITLAQNLMAVGSIPERPLILIGAEWEQIFKQLYSINHEYISKQHADMVQFAPDNAAAMLLLQQ